MSLPHAILARSSWTRQLGMWVADRLSPPRSLYTSEGFSAASLWSVTGSLAAGTSLLLVSGALWEAGLPLSVGWVLFVVFGVVFWFWPFLTSYYMYQLLARKGGARSRIGAALYGASWHAAAHVAALLGIGADPVTSLLLSPILVGALWGSWLPAAVSPSSLRSLDVLG